MVKKLLITFGIILLTLVAVVGSYFGYVLLSYKRIGNQELEVNSNATLNSLSTNNPYKIATYNIGFGAYSQDFTFFLDTGYDKDGNKTCGKHSKAFSKEEVIKNTNGSINATKDLNLDFLLLQEVDIDSTRSYHVDQRDLFNAAYTEYDSVFCMNYNSAFLAYPLNDMHGKSKAGLNTLSKYKIENANRMEYTVSKFLSKFFDLDRCFCVNILNVDNGKKLYLINSHMSAYDEAGNIRAKQLKELNDFLKSCENTGDYVIVGGDFNHDLLTYNPDFPYQNGETRFNNISKRPDWEKPYFSEDGKSPLIDGFKVVVSDNLPTCRNNDMEWNPDITYKTVVDGFIVSNNISVKKVMNIETKNGSKGIDGFAFSDHQPCYMEFTLK